MRRAAAVALAALILGAVPVAHANPDDPDDQQKFYDDAKAQGVTGKKSDLLTLGRQVCVLRTLGYDPGEIEQALRTLTPITTHIANVIRLSAEDGLC